jgi:predicted SnoaL-like aldol condensation-catalyzing enzyme
MKYYLCKKTPNVDSNTNAFISVAFDNRMIQTNGSYTYGVYHQYGMFNVGYIYKTLYWTDDYIMDGNGVSVALESIADYFEEFKVEIELEAAKIIATKKAKGDNIFITPLQIMDDGVVLYDVSCYHNGKTTRCIGASQYDCIINCYKRIREQGDTAKVFKYVVHRHIYPYGFLEEIKEKNERIRKHT